HEEINERYTRREFAYGSFRRSFTLPKSVSDDQIEASYEAGVLKLTLPKRLESLPKPKRTIEIG
ncbi:MAG TPA: Hsp20/alpha crystallin family protein, partial [Flavobacterium sp.]|nr:Hsp20/alpha crystallin family protein [Flavobacterium sp.]